MKRRILSLLLVGLMLLQTGCSVNVNFNPAGVAEYVESSGNNSVSQEVEEEKRPIIGLSWCGNNNEEFYSNIYEAVEAAGGDPVDLKQVVIPDLEYEGGKLTEGVDNTGALDSSAGKLVRNNSWINSNAGEVLEGVDAVIFLGGEDISPSLYYDQEKWHGIEVEQCYNAERDVSDYLLMDYCLDHDIPFTGFCRGMQMLGVVSGAEIIQDIPVYYDSLGREYHYEHRNEPESPGAYRDYASHAVDVCTHDSVLYEICGTDTVEGCPSWHHQALLDVDDTRLEVTGVTVVSGIDIIEAVERTDRTHAVGFQFHPEVVVARTIDGNDNIENYMEYDTALAFFSELVDTVSEE